jgi:hypothetical protein
LRQFRKSTVSRRDAGILPGTGLQSKNRLTAVILGQFRKSTVSRRGASCLPGAVPLTIRPPAPDRRPVQTTTGSAGFRSRLYAFPARNVAPLSETQVARRSHQSN